MYVHARTCKIRNVCPSMWVLVLHIPGIYTGKKRWHFLSCFLSGWRGFWRWWKNCVGYSCPIFRFYRPRRVSRVSNPCEKTYTTGQHVLYVAATVWGGQDARTWHRKHFGGHPSGRFGLANGASYQCQNSWATASGVVAKGGFTPEAFLRICMRLRRKTDTDA